MDYYKNLVKQMLIGMFSIQFPYSINHPNCNIFGYQEKCRIYLDEYEGQKEERENYFAGLPFCNNVSHIRSCVDTKLSITNFDGVSEYVRLDGKIDEVYINDVLVYLKQENNYFYNRWIRRN